MNPGPAASQDENAVPLEVNVLCYNRGYHSGRASESSRPRHGGVRGVVAVFSVRRDFDLEIRELGLGQLTCRHRLFRGVPDKLAELILDLFYKH